MRIFILCLTMLTSVTVRAYAEAIPLESGTSTCRARKNFEDRGFEQRLEDATLAENIRVIHQRLASLCERAPTDELIRSGDATGWLSMVDNVFDTLNMALFDRMARPVSAKERGVLRDILEAVVNFQREFELDRIRAYQAVRTETKEVVKTVSVPAQCPEAQEAPEPACWGTLRKSAGQWSSQLRDWMGWYKGMGDDYALAQESAPMLAGVSRGSDDPAPYLIGWLAQWHAIRRDERSLLGSGPMPRIAQDMEAKLAYCGHVVVTRGRDRR